MLARHRFANPAGTVIATAILAPRQRVRRYGEVGLSSPRSVPDLRGCRCWEAPMSDTYATGEVGDVDEVDESGLVKAAQAGNKAAMGQLLGRHQAYVDRLCQRMLRNPHDAEDARQEAWINAAHRIATFDGRAAFRTWLHIITVRVCLNKIRSTKKKTEMLVDEVPERPATSDRPKVRRRPRKTTPDLQDRVAARIDVESCLNAVTPVYRDALVLWFIADRSYAQIAEDLAIEINTVRTRLFRGKAELANCLREHIDLPGVSNP